MKLLLASTSTVHGSPYLDYLRDEWSHHFAGRLVVFVPYARPGGMTWDDYTARPKTVMALAGITVKGVHEFASVAEAAHAAEGWFVGGGNTFMLRRTLRETGLEPLLDASVRSGIPYMGSSAGINIAGISIGTTNDMPVVEVPTLNAMGWVPFNLNPHYIDPIEGSTHMGETRDERIAEFHAYNSQPVIGLREGSWLTSNGRDHLLHGPHSARIFRAGLPVIEHPQGPLSF
ncbi:MAG: dipeptidase PepE [Bacteroidota bacterium]